MEEEIRAQLEANMAMIGSSSATWEERVSVCCVIDVSVWYLPLVGCLSVLGRSLGDVYIVLTFLCPLTNWLNPNVIFACSLIIFFC